MKQRILCIAIACGFLSAAGAAQSPAPPPLSLSELEQMALTHNPTLRQAADEVTAAAGRARQAGLWPNPTVGYQGAQIRGGASRGGEQGVFVQQEIVLGHKLQAAQQAAAAAQRQQQSTADAQRQAVLTAVRLAFYDALEAQSTLALRHKLLAIAQDAADTTNQLANVGQADRPDQLQAQVEAGQARMDVTEAEQRNQQTWQQLAATVGEPGLPPGQLAGDLTTLPAAITTATYMQQLLTSGPQVRTAEAGVVRAQAELRSARKQPIPNLTVRGGMEANRELSELTGRPVGWQGFAEVSVPLPLFNRNQGNIETGAADLDRAQQELGRVRLQLRQEAAPRLAEYHSDLAAIEQYRKQLLPQAQEAYEMYLKNYQNMAAAYPQVLVAQRTWFQLQAGYTAALGRLWRSATELQGFLLTAGLQAPATIGGGQ